MYKLSSVLNFFIIILLIFLSINIYSNSFNDKKYNLLRKYKSENILSIADIVLLNSWDKISNYKNINNDLRKIYKNKNLEKVSSFLDIYYKRNKIIKNIGTPNKFYLIGPFENIGNSFFNKDFEIEKSFIFDKIYEGKSQNVFWKKIDIEKNKNYIDLANFLNNKSDSIAYLTIFFEVLKRDKYQLRVGSAEKLKLFLDSKIIITKDYYSKFFPDQNIINLDLKPGYHKITIKITNKKGWKIYFRILDKYGKLTNNIKYMFLNKNFKISSNSFKILSSKHPLIEELDKIEKKDFIYYFKRAIIEEKYIPFDIKLRPLKFEKWFKEAEKYLPDNKFIKSFFYYQWGIRIFDKDKKDKIIKKSSNLDNIDATIKLAKDYLSINFFTKVKELIDKAETIDSTYIDLYLLKYNFYKQLGVENYFLFKKLSKLKPNSNYYKFIISKLLKKDSYDSLINLYIKYLKSRFFYSNDYLVLLNMLKSKQRFKEYENFLFNRLKKDKLNYKYNNILFNYLYSKKRYNEIIELYKKNELILKDDPTTLKLIGKTYQMLNNLNKMVLFYKKYLEFKPSDSKIRKYLSFIELNKKELWAEKYISKIKKDELKVDKKILDNPAYFNYDHTLIKINKDYSYNYYHTYSITINSEELLNKYKQIYIYYNSEDEKIYNSKVTIKKSNGERIEFENYIDRYYRSKRNGAFMNYSKRVYFIDNIKKGDTIIVEYYKENRNIYHNNFFGHIFNTKGVIPKIYSTYTLFTNPKDNIKLFFNTKYSDRFNGYHFQYKNLEEIKFESNSTSYSDNYPYISVSTFKNWEEVILWYQNLTKDVDYLSEKVKNDILNGTKNYSNTIDKVKWIQEYVLNKTHYVGIELGINSYKPYKAIEVLDRKFGDCKDKANLFNSLLKIVGIDSYMVLVRTRHLGKIGKTPPNPRYFNHAISYIPTLDLYVDTTAELNGLNSLPISDQDMPSLIIKKGETIKSIPIFYNDRVINFVGKRDNDNLVGSIEVKLSGAMGARARYSLQNNKKRVDQVEQQFKDIFDKFVIKDLKIINIDLIQKPLIYNFKIDIKEYFKKNRLNISNILANIIKRLNLHPTRDNNMYLPLSNISENIKIEGIRLKDIKNDLKKEIDNEYYKFIHKLTISGNTIKIENRFKFKKYRILKQSYKLFLNKIFILKKLFKNTIYYLEKK